MLEGCSDWQEQRLSALQSVTAATASVISVMDEEIRHFLGGDFEGQ